MSATVQDLAGTDRLLVALDFDGTLSPLTDEPMAARMLPQARAAVTALAAVPDTTVALVSGRALPDLRIIAEHDDASPWLLAGSHGAEFWTGANPATPRNDDGAEATVLRDRLRSRAEALAEPLDGVWVEPKTFGFAVHSRLADEPTSAEATRTMDALVRAEAPHWRRRLGHNIVEYAFRSEGKDTAVQRLRELTAATAVLFAGDDITDEDALGSLGAGDLGVLVGDRAETHASLRVPDIAAMAALLADLADRRRQRRG